MNIQLNDQNQFLRVLPGGNVEFDEDTYQPAHTLTPEQATTFRVHLMQPTPTPAYNTLTHSIRAATPLLLDGTWTQQWEVFPLPVDEATANVRAHRAGLVQQIDEAVAGIYTRFTRFGVEYEAREAEAQAFKDAGYTGPVPGRISEFAVPAGMEPIPATDLILAQAANLRAALGKLSALRMRKYEVTRAPNSAAAQAVATEILAAIDAAGKQVS